MKTENGKLKKYKLGELMEVTRGMSLCGDYYATEGNLMRLTLGNFDYRNNCFKDDKSKDNLYFSGDVKTEFILNEGDIITPLTEQAIGLLGSTAKVPCSGKYIQSQDVGLIKCNDKLNPDFAYYLIPSKLVRTQLSAAAQQTKIRHTSPDKIKNCTVWIPDYSTQEKIGKLLSALDDKIALNRRMNAKLEQMAKRLYDHWFVQFDFPNADGKPYKASGDKMVWNETLKREIPEGWEVIQIKDIATLERGISYSKENLVDAGTPMISLASFSPDSSYKENCIKYYQGDIDSCDYLNPYDVLMCTTQQTDIDNVTDIIGKCIVVPDVFREQAVFTTDLVKVKVEQNLGLIISCETKLPWYNKYITGFASGTSIKHLNTAGFLNYSIALPKDVDIINKFANIIMNFKRQQSVIMKETQKLTALRDRLLPLLMNGQVEVV